MFILQYCNETNIFSYILSCKNHRRAWHGITPPPPTHTSSITFCFHICFLYYFIAVSFIYHVFVSIYPYNIRITTTCIYAGHVAMWIISFKSFKSIYYTLALGRADMKVVVIIRSYIWIYGHERDKYREKRSRK